jgi:hypothetical protein
MNLCVYFLNKDLFYKQLSLFHLVSITFTFAFSINFFHNQPSLLFLMFIIHIDNSKQRVISSLTMSNQTKFHDKSGDKSTRVS